MVGHTHGVTNRLRQRVPTAGLAAGLALAAALGLAACGRSAPEGALPESSNDGVEPAAAGVRVSSDISVLPPSPTTVPPPSTEAPSTTAPPVTAPAGSYVVASGDTLSVIAERFGVSVDAISEANGITDPNSIRPGQELIIPGAG